MELLLFVVAFAFAVVLYRLLLGGFDEERVETYLRHRGWKLIDKSWDPFGPGWFGEKDSRIYRIVYSDEQGRTHRAHVKTSMLSGVYLTNDEIVSEAPQTTPPAEDDLEAENARLRARIAELESERES